MYNDLQLSMVIMLSLITSVFVYTAIWQFSVCGSVV